MAASPSETLAARRTIPVLMTIVLLVMAGMGMVIPVLSLYAQSFGVGSLLIGMIITVFGLARLCVNLPAGLLADRRGRRPLLWGGPAILAAASVAAALADDFALLLVCRFVQGVGSGLYMTGAMIAIADLSTPDNRGRRLGAYQTALLTGTAIGPAIGGLLADRWGYTAPFWGFAAASAAAALIAFWIVPETRPATARPVAGGHRQGLGSLLRQPGFALVALIAFGVFFTRTAAQWQFIPLVAAHRFAMAPATIGIALALSAAMTVLTTPMAGWLADRLPRPWLIIGSALGVAVTLAILALTDQPWLFWSALLALGAALAIGAPATSAFATECAPPGQHGPALGLLRTAGDLGFVAGPLLAGLAVDLSSFGDGAGLLLNALLMAGAALAFGNLPRRYSSKETLS